MKPQHLDVMGIGIGPANLGLAALLSDTDITHRFFDAKNNFTWHGGVSNAPSDLQVHYLKDLVTMVAPTNPYSFISFLHANHRIYQFLNQNTTTVSRQEYEHYYQWVSQQLNSLQFNAPVSRIEYRHGLFTIQIRHTTYCSPHIVMGVGKKPHVPAFARPHLSASVLHSSDFHDDSTDHRHKTICVIGGGQSAAEIVYSYMRSPLRPKTLYWVNKHYRFYPLEDSCFSNEYYTPSYCRHFYTEDPEHKTHLNQLLLDTNNGITLSLLDKIYQLAYSLKFIEKSPFQLIMLPAHTCFDLTKKGHRYHVFLSDNLKKKEKIIPADQVIFATGYQRSLPDCLTSSVLPTVDVTHYKVHHDFSLNWEHENTNKIYIQNGADHQFGLSDTNLGVFSFRNASIINSLLKKEHYALHDHSLLFTEHDHAK